MKRHFNRIVGSDAPDVHPNRAIHACGESLSFKCFVSIILMVLFVNGYASESLSSDEPGTTSSLSTVWSAKTEFGGFDLTINNDYTQVTHVSLQLDEFKCGGITLTGNIKAESRDIWPILNNQFEVTTNLGIYKIIIYGAIDDPRTKIYGTWKINSLGTTCTDTWEAE